MIDWEEMRFIALWLAFWVVIGTSLAMSLPMAFLQYKHYLDWLAS